jgi:hypothetical protein
VLQNELSKIIERSPVLRDLIREREGDDRRRKAAEHSTAAKALKQLTHAREKETEKFVAELEKLEADEKGKHAAYEAAEQARKQKELDIRSASAGFETAQRKLERELIANAPPEIDGLEKWIDDEIAAARKQTISSDSEDTGKRNLLTMKRIFAPRTAFFSLNRRLAALSTARETARSLRLEDLSQKRLAERIDEIKRSIPPIRLETVGEARRSA